MSDIIAALKRIILKQTTAPNDASIFINEAIGTAGKEFDLVKLLGGAIPNNIELYSTQNFTLRRSLGDKSPEAEGQWPRTLILGTWHKWRNEAWYRITFIPGVAATLTAHISANHVVNRKES